MEHQIIQLLKKSYRVPWAWIFFLLAYAAYVFLRASMFFSPDFPQHLYYQFLIAFDTVYLVPYSLNVLSIIFDFFSFLPFLLFLTKTTWLSPGFWRGMLIVRFILEMTGRSYEWALVRSLFFQDLRTPLFLIASVLALLLPSYVTFFITAFRRQPSQNKA